MRNAFDFVDKHFQGNEGIYGVGFSLGGNYIMRSAGMPNACEFKGIVTIAQPFDVVATCINLQYTMGGLYDAVMAKTLKEPFVADRFHPSWSKDKNIQVHGQPLSFFKYDAKVRGRMLGYNGCVHIWYREVSW